MIVSSPSWPIAILDIGSNSIRLVIFEEKKKKKPLFNQKIICHLGKKDALNNIKEENFNKAIEAIKHFLNIIKEFSIKTIIAVATASLREAKNGKDFLNLVKKELGLEIQILSGKEEAYYAGLGVLTTYKNAKGMIADLGGGSLDITRITQTHEVEKDGLTLPVGTLRLKENEDNLHQFCLNNIKEISQSYLKNKRLYLVGGSFRAFGKALSIEKKKSALKFKTNEAIEFCRKIRLCTFNTLNTLYQIDDTRLPHMHNISILLEHLLDQGEFKKVYVSKAGIRDGIIKEIKN